MAFELDGFLCCLTKDLGESTEHYVQRGYFVVSQKPQTEEEYDDAVLFSRIYIHVKHKGCEYDESIMKKLDSMINIMDSCCVENEDNQ
jgi:hypothetical protein